MAAPYPFIGETDPNHPLEVEGQFFLSNVEQGTNTNFVPFEILSNYRGITGSKLVGARQLRLRVMPSVGATTANVSIDMGIEPTNGDYFYITPPIEDSNVSSNAAFRIVQSGDVVMGTGSLTNASITNASITNASITQATVSGTVTTSNINGDATLYINGTTTVGGDLSVTGSITADGNITAYSDKRLKSDIKRIENALEKLTSIGGYTYMMNGMTNTGLIAQEVLEILPEAVSGSEDTKYALAYGNLMGIVVEAIKELKEDVEKIKNKINI